MSGGRSRTTQGCDSVRPRLTLHYYGAAEEPEALQRHLETCASCATHWAATVRDLRSIDSAAAFPREADVDWEELARRTVQRARAAEQERGAARVRPFPLRPAGRRALLWGGVVAAA